MSLEPAEIEKQISSAMLREQFHFRRQLKNISAKLKSASQKSKPDQVAALDQQLAELAEKVKLSSERRARRQEALSQNGQNGLDESLPIFERREEIIQTIRDHQVVVISGATGSGKSTQLPLMCLQAGYGVSGLIGHTQPRRIAARSVASRIAQQTKTEMGSTVGFKIRFADQTSDDTFIKLMTDGILLAETQSDRFLEQYELIIVDEAHERSLNIDFLLGYLKNILHRRPNFRLIITSATIDTERFVEHFTTDPENPAPIINVEGRTYPVEIRYAAPAEGDDILDWAVTQCQDLSRADDGDMLVFLPTENDIRTLAKKLRPANLRGNPEILPLYARLSTDQQNLIFNPGGKRRVVLATNVAESSITVPRIRFVVDTGLARISRYAPRSKVQRLPIEAISQASADQRAGRCGRIGPGICVRLYDEDDYESRSKFTTPEIRRTNLASVILQTLHLKLGNIDEFPFIDPPHPESIRDGFKTLFEICAVDDHRRLTPLGRKLARLPVDPRIGRMLFAADEEGCLADILIVASALEIQDPRVRPAEKKGAADAAHEEFLDPESDFLSLLKIWDFFHNMKESLSRSKLRIACQRKFLSYSLLRQWQEIHRQLKSMCRDQGLSPGQRKDDYNAIHRSLVAGLLSGVALRGDRHEYTGARGIKFHVWPGSGVFESKPKWAIVSEIVETTRRYGRTVGKISPEWIEPMAEHLVKRNCSDPHWSQKQQTVMAYETVSLFGLPIVARRRIGFGKVDPEAARELFIEEALANDQLESNFDFHLHNQMLLEEIKEEAAKTRNRDLLIDPYTLVSFFRQRLPEGIFGIASLRRKLKKQPKLDEKLRLTRADLLPEETEPSEELYPKLVQVGSMQVPVSYRFSPGDDDDGATVELPVEGIGQLDEAQTGWLIPGLIETRVIGLIRSLPKPVRRMFVPAPETAKKVVAQMEHGRGHFVEAVAIELSRIAGQPVTPDQFKQEKVDRVLKVNVRVKDADGAVIAEGRSIAEVRDQLGAEHASNIVETDNSEWNQDGLTDWTWGDFPRESTIKRGGTELAAFPTIIDQGDAVGLRLADAPDASDMQTRQGLVRLFKILNKKSVRSQVRHLPSLEQHAVTIHRLMTSDQFKKQLGDLMIRIAMVEREKIPRDESAFRAMQASSVERIALAASDMARWLPKMIKSAQAVFLALEKMPDRFSSAKGDMKFQLKQLTTETFLADTPWKWLQHYPRYFEAMAMRAEKLGSTPVEKERDLRNQVSRQWELYESANERHQRQAIVDPELQTFRWMIEELRVSLFAQKLGTAITVSDKRLEKQWKKVRQV